MLHFATFWALATKRSTDGRLSVFGLIGVIFFIIFFLVGFFYKTGGCFFFNYLWQDFFFSLGVTSSMTIQVLHYFFFRFFVFETVLLNFYLLFSLILALGLLSLFKLYGGLKFSSKVFGSSKSNRELDANTPTRQTSTIRTRQISKFRRQTRRQNSSIVRYR